MHSGGPTEAPRKRPGGIQKHPKWNFWGLRGSCGACGHIFERKPSRTLETNKICGAREPLWLLKCFKKQHKSNVFLKSTFAPRVSQEWSAYHRTIHFSRFFHVFWNRFPKTWEFWGAWRGPRKNVRRSFWWLFRDKNHAKAVHAEKKTIFTKCQETQAKVMIFRVTEAQKESFFGYQEER